MKRILSMMLLCLCLLPSCKKMSPKDSVVEMLVSSGMGGGTGFEVIAPSGKKYTLTNAHVCRAEATFAVVDNRLIPLRVIETSTTSDLCLLEEIAGAAGLSVASFSPKSDDVIDIYGYGLLQDLTHTQGFYVGRLKGNMAAAICLFLGECSVDYVSATILPGNSGSPVLNSSGEVVGVVFASGSEILNRALIVSLQDVVTFLSPY